MTREVKTDDLIFISHPPTTPIPMPLFSSPPPFFLVPLHPSLPHPYLSSLLLPSRSPSRSSFSNYSTPPSDQSKPVQEGCGLKPGKSLCWWAGRSKEVTFSFTVLPPQSAVQLINIINKTFLELSDSQGLSKLKKTYWATLVHSDLT